MSNVGLDSPFIIFSLDRLTTQRYFITTVANQTCIHQSRRITRSRTYCSTDNLVFGVTAIVVDITPQAVTQDAEFRTNLIRCCDGWLDIFINQLWITIHRSCRTITISKVVNCRQTIWCQSRTYLSK